MIARALLLPTPLALACCALKPVPTTTDPDRIAIVASEHGPRGLRLVAIDEHGDRRFEIIEPATTIVQDKNPAISPDGRWVVFASTRGRTDGTSLWIARLAVEAKPRPLTTGPAIDTHPVWHPSGAAIVFASTRDGGDYDLWRIAIDTRGAAKDPVQLTTDPGHEITPTVAPDGAIAYTAVAQQDTVVTSRLEELAPDGTVRALTEGPADASPAYSPDGTMLVFARPAMHQGKPHSELWRMTRSGASAKRLVVLPLTEESGPVFSRDGRFIFATSRLAGAETKTLFSSVVHVDLREATPRARILSDSSGAVSRLTPAVVALRLDVAALHADPEYLPELARIMASKIEEQIREK